MSENQSSHNQSLDSQSLDGAEPRLAPPPSTDHESQQTSLLSVSAWEAEQTEAEQTEAEQTRAEPIETETAIEPAEDSVANSHKDTQQQLADADADADVDAGNVSTPANRENELLSLIRDLNDCNDALLAQVSKLEGDVQRTEANATAEIEKAKVAVQLAQEKMNRQVSVEQASAQQVSQTAQQQVARLVSELDTAEQTLSRQVLANENLKTELAEAQANVIRLERECAIASQKHAEEVQARLQAETQGRDLRSRLQRQQRYTLQFKAALEKSLTVGAASASPRTSPAEAARPVSFNPPTGVSMPRSQRIMPWASAQSSTAFQGIDPHLEALIRRGAQPSAPEPAPTPAQATAHTDPSVGSAASQIASAPAESVSPEAEARLWQDLERVMTTEAKEEERNTKDLASEEADSQPMKYEASEAQLATATAIDAEDMNAQSSKVDQASKVDQSSKAQKAPRLNWQAESRQAKDESERAVEKMEELVTTPPSESISESISESTEDSESEQAIAQPVNLNNTALAEALAKAKQKARLDSTSAEDVVFTEPSPWKNPVATPEAIEQPAVIPTPPISADHLPAVDSSNVSTVSPVAKPLSPQKKIGSFASVELPTFPSAKSASFKR